MLLTYSQMTQRMFSLLHKAKAPAAPGSWAEDHEGLTSLVPTSIKGPCTPQRAKLHWYD